MKGILSLVFLGLILVVSDGMVQAKSFTNQYCEFQLPNGWECALEGSEWVCQHTNVDRKKEAIIILAAKIRGASDSLDQYEAHLKKQKVFNLPGGKTQISEAKYTRKSLIKNHAWIDSLHLASEVPGFYTRYLATVKEDLGVAVTFSVAKNYYSDYQSIFDRIAATLKVFRSRKQGVGEYRPVKRDGDILDKAEIDSSDMVVDIGRQRSRKGGGASSGATTGSLLVFLLIGAGIVIFIIKKRKGKKKKKKKK